LQALTCFANSGEGDVKALTGPWHGSVRLRVGDYRVVFALKNDEATIMRIRHRSDVYR